MQVSTYQTKITPAGEFFPCHLMGHAIRTEMATGILHDLWATALVLEVEGSTLVWVTADLIGLPRESTDRLRSRIAQQYHIALDAINIAYTHTHSGPEYEDTSFFRFFGAGAVPGYMAWVEEQMFSAVEGCFSAGFTQAELYVKKQEISGYYSNRNGLHKPCDKSFITMEFRSGDRVVAGACSFACHSTVLGPQNLQISSDLAGYIGRSLRDTWGVYPVIMVGAAGDMSNRLYREGNDEAELQRVGSGIMQQVYEDRRPAQRLSLSRPVVRTFHYEREFSADRSKKQEQYDKIKEKVENAQTFDEKKVYSSALKMAELRLREDYRFRLDLECRYVDMGDMRLFIIPAELFSRFGLRLKEEMGGACPICWCYSNYGTCYLGNEEDYGASFETSASDIPPGTTEKIVEEMAAFIRKYRE